MKRRHRAQWFFLAICLAILAAALIYVMWPFLADIGVDDSSNAVATAARFEQIERSVSRAQTLFLTAWFFAVGASVGSFLNVVVYRMPLGRSLIWQGSFCPHCTTSIRARDNIPVLGWIMLGGRCRACRLPIAVRYPIVEAVTGFALLGLAAVEVMAGGVNLPHWQGANQTFFNTVMFTVNWPLVRLFLFHSALVCFLLCAALIRWDQHVVPRMMIVAMAMAGLGFPLLWIELRPLTMSMNAVATGMIGATTGMVVGGVWLAIHRPFIGSLQNADVIAMLVVSGLFLGWDGVLWSALVALLCELLSLALIRGRRAGRGELALFAGTWLAILLWRFLSP